MFVGIGVLVGVGIGVLVGVGVLVGAGEGVGVGVGSSVGKAGVGVGLFLQTTGGLVLGVPSPHLFTAVTSHL